jgi:hypothetical protein
MRYNTMNTPVKSRAKLLANLVAPLVLGVAVIGVASFVPAAHPAVAADKEKDKKDENKVIGEVPEGCAGCAERAEIRRGALAAEAG